MNKLLYATVFFCATAGSAQAVGNLADVGVYDRTEQRMLPVIYHDGRHYVVGKPGNEYQLAIRNQQPGEVMTVVSVDGINAVTGETAGWGQTGYVFGPRAAYDIKGWRKSLQRVARFYFTELDSSYAARTGRPENVGVIGVAVFRRKAEPAVNIGRVWEQKRDASRGEGAPAEARSDRAESTVRGTADAAGRQQPAVPEEGEKSLGTGHGAGETSPVRYTSFERATSTPEEVITIYYDSYRNLLAQGVIKAQRISRPAPFPGHFVPDPR